MISSEHKKTIFIIISILFIGVLVTIYRTHFQPLSAEYVEQEKKSVDLTASPNMFISHKETILVHIAGLVQNPGIYKINKGSRTADLIKIAGGALPNANLDKINLVAILKDGKKILISATKPTKTKTTKTRAIGQMVNINTSSAKDLTTITGIGPSTAQKIVDYRNTKGRFETLKDLTNVKGIGPKTLKKIKPYLLL
ncbi:ComEA family DNA-binding protein [bacterium]|jgi:comEA protein|nr:ComEA family DNA-binding protein [bacterium]MBT3580667.1 ComEA family DNA-binding protein [bacterium]MBT4552202.1 ComEA family DNA-binding protein [bacterium]